ncbi:MAG: RNA-binding protein, partial [Nitrososphaeraceae archaeon]|nr:RNA-binding protein [Nitrososphaeraceae archaeon]
IEDKCSVTIEVDSEYGDTIISAGTKPVEEMEPFKAVEIVSAIGKGFSPERAYRLLSEEEVLQLIDLRDYAGKSPNALSRIKGRIIGEAGKSRKTIEDLSGTYISVYGHNVAIIGTFEETKLATEAVTMLSKGRSHANVYNMLQEAKRKSKLDRMQLWENDTMRKL